MGKQDVATKEYLSDPVKFADLFNYFLYNGRQVIKPDDLQPGDVSEWAFEKKGIGKRKGLQRSRDLLKRWLMFGKQADYVLLGVENQSNVHYAMPVKHMLYDALNYDRQVKCIGKKYADKNLHLSQAEFLSGIRKGDRLKPVITLTLFLKSEPWDGPRTLHDMLDVPDKSLLRYIPNYPLNLIIPNEIGNADFSKFQSSLKLAMEFIKASSNEEDMEYLLQNDAFRKVDRSTAEFLSDCTSLKFSIPEEGELINMCKAFEQHEASGFKRGKEAGIEIGRAEAEKGMCKAFEQHEASGFKRGREAGSESSKREIARNMLICHLAVETIMQCTDLSETDIRELEVQLRLAESK